MKQFQGFPARGEFTALPNLFLSEVLPDMEDAAEIKTALHLMARLYRKKGYPQLVSLSELQEDDSLMRGLGGGSGSAEEALRRALEAVAARGIFLRAELEKKGKKDEVYLLNNEAGRQALARIGSGEIRLDRGSVITRTPAEEKALPDIFTLYEENIGMLTPMIAEELKEAEKSYPPDWLRDAIREAVSQNKRKWSYIAAILRSWSAGGRSDGAYQRHLKEDPDRYVKGKYGHMVRRR
jgi:DNA replication protein